MLPLYDVNHTEKFIHPDDTTEPRTEFTIGVIDARAMAWVDKTFTQLLWTKNGEGKPEPNVQIDTQGKQIELVKLGLRAVSNFPRSITIVPEQYPFGQRFVVDDASINAIAPYIPALAKAIENMVAVTPADEKK